MRIANQNLPTNFLIWLSCMLLPFGLPAQQSSGIIKIAILPTITNIQKDLLRADIDAVSLAQIQEKEALNTQSKNYYLIAQKNPNYKVTFQPFTQTNAILQQAGITFSKLPEIDQQELARLLEVDMIFYGINYRTADPNTPEERLAINVGLAMLLPPAVGGLARASDKPITTMHYLLYDSNSNKAIWHFKDETTRPTDLYIEKFRRFLAYNFPLRK